jgi:hypothetical protein
LERKQGCHEAVGEREEEVEKRKSVEAADFGFRV